MENENPLVIRRTNKVQHVEVERKITDDPKIMKLIEDTYKIIKKQSSGDKIDYKA